MIRHIGRNYSESWKKLPWKQFRRNLFRLQVRLYKAVREGDNTKALSLQRLILRSQSARYLAIRQVTQLNQGRKTAGVDGLKALNFKQRFELEETLKLQWHQWKHNRLREIPIPKKDRTKRILKVPTISDRAWQKLVHYALEPAHEANFHAKSYGFRLGRSAHDAQKIIFLNLKSDRKGKEKTILELDIKKCFDRINHSLLMKQTLLVQSAKLGLWRCLKVGVNPEFPEQGTPQGGIVSPTLANIALNGIEQLGMIVRYADDLVAILKPSEDALALLQKISEFLAIRGLEVKQEKTRIVPSTEGFDFLGWHIKVQKNGKFRCVPSQDNYKAFRTKVKSIVNNSNFGARVKASKLAPIIRGWRNYHRYCQLDGSRYSLWFLEKRTWKVFSKEQKLNRYQVDALIRRAFPSVPYSENKHVNVKGNKSPYDGDIIYWAARNSKAYDGTTAKALKKQQHRCGHCGLKFITDEKVHLHHRDGNHNNWNPSNLLAVHQSCHDYIHMARQNAEVI